MNSQKKDKRAEDSKPAKKENILDLSLYVDKKIHINCAGGREVCGILKGYDQLTNLVLDEAFEFVRDPVNNFRVTERKRALGLIVIRSTAINLIHPDEGYEEIENPFNLEE